MLVILLIGVARFEKGRTCKQHFKTVDLYWAEPVGSIGPTGWFSVSTVARFTSIPNYLASVPPRFCDVVLRCSKYVCGFNFSLSQGILNVLMSVFMTPSFCAILAIVD